jgi:hypothetical protein
MNPDDEVPLWLWRTVIGGFIAGLVAIGVMLGLALAGTFDPKPVGELVIDIAPEMISHLDAEGMVSDPAGVTLHAPGTIEASLHVAEGPPTTYNGIELTGPGGRIVVLTNGNGYMIASTDDVADLRSLAERATHWPHIHPPGETNVLRIDLTEQGATVRINDEVALADTPISPGGAWTLNVVGVSIGDGARVQLDRVRVWEASAP